MKRISKQEKADLILSKKASKRVLELLKNPPEPNEFLIRAKQRYLKNVKTN